MVASAATLRDSSRLFGLALSHGFEALRDDARGRILRRGTVRFVLPASGDANGIVAKAILDICNDLDSKNKKPSKTPLEVFYQGATWAVFSSDAARYQLQSTVDGHRVWVDKLEVQEVVTNDSGRMNTPQPNGHFAHVNGANPPREPTPDPVALERMAARVLPPVEAFTKEEPTVAETMPAPEPEAEGPKLAVHEASSFEELSPLAYSRNEMKRQIERTQLRIEMEEAKIKPLYDQLAAFQAAYAALSGGIAQAVQPPRRTVLPPSGPGGTRTARGEAVASSQRGVPKKRLSYEDRFRIRELLSEGKEPKQIIAVMGDHIQYHHISAQRDAMAAGRELLRS